MKLQIIAITIPEHNEGLLQAARFVGCQCELKILTDALILQGDIAESIKDNSETRTRSFLISGESGCGKLKEIGVQLDFDDTLREIIASIETLL